MGLSGPRKRAKLSHDPNNIAWSRSSARFGQKLLLSHGWTPGSSLGVNGAPYANNPASTSHVRVTVKDDNLGLGARNGARNDDGPTTGLDGLQHLLGRLNGKDEKLLEKEQRCREDTKRTLYAERRWGLGSFVSGGFLVKDRIQDRVDVSLERVAPTNSLSDKGSKKVSKSKLHKTRKEKSEKARESMPLHGTVTLAQGSSSATSSQSKNPSGIDNEPDAEQPGTSEDSTLKANRRLAKMERRAQRKARNAEKAAARALEQTTREPPDSIPSAGEAKTQVSEAARTHGRHAVRQRFIQHKKMSLADQKALNEILMIRG